MNVIIVLKNQGDTWEEIKKIWYKDVNSILSNLYNSMNNRIQEVVKLKGKCINY